MNAAGLQQRQQPTVPTPANANNKENTTSSNPNFANSRKALENLFGPPSASVVNNNSHSELSKSGSNSRLNNNTGSSNVNGQPAAEVKKPAPPAPPPRNDIGDSSSSSATIQLPKPTSSANFKRNSIKNTTNNVLVNIKNHAYNDRFEEANYANDRPKLFRSSVSVPFDSDIYCNTVSLEHEHQYNNIYNTINKFKQSNCKFLIKKHLVIF